MKTLCVIGAGIKTISHLTIETKEYLKNADIVLHLLNEPIMVNYIAKHAKKTLDLSDTYYSVDSRSQSYDLITSKIIEQFEFYTNVCVIFYGHPIFCAKSTKLAIEIAKESNIHTISCPAISSLDCLFSDLNIDPAEQGLQLYTADYLINNRPVINKYSRLVILQSGFVKSDKHTHVENLNWAELPDFLYTIYPCDQECIIYEASIYPHKSPIIQKIALDKISVSNISSITTIII